MKNFKKVVALVLAFAMTLSLGTVAFAATDNATEADVLYDLGLFKGYSTTEKQLGLEDPANAAQALVLIGRALGWEVDNAATVTFTDVPDYAVPYVAKAVELGITQGVSETTFGVENIDGKRMTTWVLRSLGYDSNDAWNKTDELAKEAGLTVPSVTAVTRDTVAGVIFDTLDATKVGETKTVIETLIDGNDALKAVAEKAGLVNPTPDTLEVESITADNLKEITVKFNKEVDVKTVVDGNFTVKEGTVSRTVKASLADDKMTVTLKAETALKNQKEHTVKVSNVKDLNGVKIETVTKTINVLDTTLPEVQEVKVTGPKSLELTFNEPINTLNNSTRYGKVTVKTGTTTVGSSSSFDASNGKKVVTVELYTSLKEDTTYTVSIEGFRDYAGYTMINASKSVDYVKDTTAVTATITKATQKYVVVEFNKPVKNLTNKHFYHSFSSWTALKLYTSDEFVAANEITSKTKAYSKVYVEFATSSASGQHPLQSGTTNVTILNKVDSYELQDNWGNKYAGETIAVEVQADTDAPVVTEIKVSAEDELKVIFDEDVDFSRSNIDVYDPDGKKIGISSVTTSKADTEFKVVLEKKYSGKTLKVTIKDVKDKSLQGNKLTNYTEDISITDKTAPKVNTVSTSTSGSDKFLYVFFSEEVTDTALNKNNYVFEKAGAYDKLEGDIEFYEDNKTVRIGLKTDDSSNITNGYNLLVRGIKDLNDNEMVGQTIANASIKDASLNPAKLKGDFNNDVKILDKNKIEFTYDQRVEVVNDAAFVITANSTTATITSRDVTTNSDGETVIALTFDYNKNVPASYIAADGSNFGSDVTLAIVDKNSTTNEIYIKNSLGVAATPYSSFTVVDKVKPQVAKDSNDKYMIETLDVDTDGHIDHLLVTFEEALILSSVSPSNFDVENYTVLDAYTVAAPGTPTVATDGNKLLSRSSMANANGKYVYVAVKEKTIFDTGVTPRVSITGEIKDLKDNKFEELTNKTALDKAKPVLATAVAGVKGAAATSVAEVNDTLILTFSEDVKFGGTTFAATGVTLANVNSYFSIAIAGGSSPTHGDLTSVVLTPPVATTFDMNLSGSTLTLTIKSNALSTLIVDATAINSARNIPGAILDNANNESTSNSSATWVDVSGF